MKIVFDDLTEIEIEKIKAIDAKEGNVILIEFDSKLLENVTCLEDIKRLMENIEERMSSFREGFSPAKVVSCFSNEIKDVKLFNIKEK